MAAVAKYLFVNDPILIVNEDGSTYAPKVSVRLIRAVIGVAAFAGLRVAEIRGLWWEDDELSVPQHWQSVWHSVVLDETKNHEDEDNPGVLPIIQPLRLMLDQIRPQAGRAGCSQIGSAGHSNSTISLTG